MSLDPANWTINATLANIYAALKYFNFFYSFFYCLAEAGLKLSMKLKLALAQPVIFPVTLPRDWGCRYVSSCTLTPSFYRGRNYSSEKTQWRWQQPVCDLETRPTPVLLAPAVDTEKRAVVQVKMRQVQEELLPIYVKDRHRSINSWAASTKL